MKVYVFKCTECEHIFEYDCCDNLPYCPLCNGKSRRLYTPINFAIN